MATAAEALLPDYAAGGELTVFTVLDSEDFRGEVWLINWDPADAFQVRSVAQERFVRRLGKLSDIAMQEITKALAVVLSIEL